MVKEWLETYKKTNELMRKYGYALFILNYDATTDCPKLGREYSYDVQAFFQQKLIELNKNKDYEDAIINLYKNKDSLDPFDALQIEEDYREFDKLKRIPNEMMFKHIENVNRSSMEWQKARTTLDYQKFEVELKELVDYYKEYVKLMPNKGKEGFDVLLEENETDFSVEKYDPFFDLIKKEIVPLAKKICTLPKKYNEKLDHLTFDIDKQKKLTKIIMNMMGYTDEVGCVRETIHPFTGGMHSKDIRITTSYDEHLLFSNLYSVMHETGHALYELGQDPKLNGTTLFGGTSMGIHESQSRFMENYLGRSYAFTKKLYQIVKKLFPTEMEGITVDDLYYYANHVSNQFKRTEADELTYSIHILIRYEVEKKLFRGEISVDEISDTFNDLFYEYLGVRPSNKLEGCYQDVHWSTGFGYFPTYAIGNAYAAQFYNAMKKDLDVDALMEEGNFKPINAWLDDKIHKYGKSKKNLWIIEHATGEKFNPNYYIEYLKDKFKKIYNI